MSDNSNNSDAGKFQNRLIPLTKWQDYFPWPSTASLRFLVHNSKTNGFDKVIKRAGGRLLISEAAFEAWVDEQDEEAKVN